LIGFDEFLDAELPGLKRYARLLAGDREDGHDLLTDVLLGAHLRWSRIGGIDRPDAYVRRMITNQFLSDRRRWSFRMIKPTPTGELPDRALPRDETALMLERADLHDRLAALPRQQRAAVVMRYYLDLSDAQIAAELHISLSGVRSSISRALSTLRVEDDPAPPDPEPPDRRAPDRPFTRQPSARLRPSSPQPCQESV